MGEERRTAYEILQVREDADQVVVQAAYRALAAVYHPDLNAAPGAERRMAELNDAYAVVRSPEERAAYDRLRKTATIADARAAPAPIVTPPPSRATPGDGRRRPGEDDKVAGHEAFDALPDLLDPGRALVAQDDTGRPFPLAVRDVQVGVAVEVLRPVIHPILRDTAREPARRPALVDLLGTSPSLCYFALVPKRVVTVVKGPLILIS